MLYCAGVLKDSSVLLAVPHCSHKAINECPGNDRKISKKYTLELVVTLTRLLNGSVPITPPFSDCRYRKTGSTHLDVFVFLEPLITPGPIKSPLDSFGERQTSAPGNFHAQPEILRGRIRQSLCKRVGRSRSSE